MTAPLSPPGSTPDTDQEAMLDVAANTLAVIIMVTVFALGALSEAVPTPAAPDAVPDPNLPVLLGERSMLRPVSQYHVFMDGRQFRLDGSAIFAALTETPGPVLNRETPQGIVTFLPDPTGGRDADQYSFRFEPDPHHVAGLPVLDAAAALTLAETLETRWSQTGTAPTFVVYPSGMDGFVALHEHLREETAMPWRWHALAEGEAIRISRNVHAYRNPTIYW